MSYFLIALKCVGIMLLMALPGYIFTKKKIIKAESISAFAKFLMYVCQPMITLYTFQAAIPYYSETLVWNMLWVLLLSLGIELLIMITAYLSCGKKKEEARFRVMSVSTVLGNVAFLGVPLLEAMLPDHPEAIVYSAVFSTGMFLLSWTLGSFFLTGEKKYIKVKNMLLNPVLIALIPALPLFFTQTILPQILYTNVMILGRMTTPLCMLILGLRLGTVDVKAIFSEWTAYVAAAVKLIGMPLLAFAALYFLPLETVTKQAFFILCCCPCASMVLNLSELYGVGQEAASKNVLLGTILSIATIPLLSLFLTLF